MKTIGPWIRAMRLRTLPLAIASVLTGNFLAIGEGEYRLLVLVLSLTTAILLQILSNLANDYGDAVKGVDDAHRKGPERTVQSGVITPAGMKVAMVVMALLTLASGSWLVVEGTRGLHPNAGLLFFGVGFAAIAAAIKYTVGKNPYGYAGFGDLFVFLFFGIVGVAGPYYLQTHQFSVPVLLPAVGIGLLSAGVLNVNNMRDREMDARSGKITLAVRLGEWGARLYHLFLLLGGMGAVVTYTFLYFENPYEWLYLVGIPLFFLHLWNVYTRKDSEEALDKELRKLAISTFLLSVMFSTGMVL